MTPRSWPVGSFRHPDGVSQVRDRSGQLWRRGTTRWSMDGNRWIRWYQLSSEHGPLTEELPSREE